MAKDTEKRLLGESWTQEKLELLAKYLQADTTIFKGNARAQYFGTTGVLQFKIHAAI